MSNRHSILEEAFLFDGITISGQKVMPLSMSRRIFLKRMGNRVMSDETCDDEEEIAGVFFACCTDIESLSKYVGNADQFNNDALRWLMTLNDRALEEFTIELGKEVERLRLAQVEAVEGKQTEPVHA